MLIIIKKDVSSFRRFKNSWKIKREGFYFLTIIYFWNLSLFYKVNKFFQILSLVIIHFLNSIQEVQKPFILQQYWLNLDFINWLCLLFILNKRGFHLFFPLNGRFWLLRLLERIGINLFILKLLLFIIFILELLFRRLRYI